MKILEELQDFINGAEKRYTDNLWIQDDKMRVYVRKGRHVIAPNTAVVTLDFAAIEVDPTYRRQGLCNEFLKQAHEMNPWETTYVECVHNPILATSLIRRGWLTYEGSPNSYFMPKDMEKYYNKLILHQRFSK